MSVRVTGNPLLRVARLGTATDDPNTLRASPASSLPPYLFFPPMPSRPLLHMRISHPALARNHPVASLAGVTPLYTPVRCQCGENHAKLDSLRARLSSSRLYTPNCSSTSPLIATVIVTHNIRIASASLARTWMTIRAIRTIATHRGILGPAAC